MYSSIIINNKYIFSIVVKDALKVSICMLKKSTNDQQDQQEGLSNHFYGCIF